MKRTLYYVIKNGDLYYCGALPGYDKISCNEGSAYSSRQCDAFRFHELSDGYPCLFPGERLVKIVKRK